MEHSNTPHIGPGKSVQRSCDLYLLTRLDYVCSQRNDLFRPIWCLPEVFQITLLT